MTKEKSEYIKNWIFRANEDIAVIESLASQNLEYYSSTICFHAQQAVEKFLNPHCVRIGKFQEFLVHNPCFYQQFRKYNFVLI